MTQPAVCVPDEALQVGDDSRRACAPCSMSPWSLADLLAFMLTQSKSHTKGDDDDGPGGDRVQGALCRRSTCPRVANFATTYETHGYDGERRGAQWWFEAWGSGPKADWNRRSEVGRPPRPSELRRADYIVIGIRKGNHVIYRTHTGGLDFDPRVRRRQD